MPFEILRRIQIYLKLSIINKINEMRASYWNPKEALTKMNFNALSPINHMELSSNPVLKNPQSWILGIETILNAQTVDVGMIKKRIGWVLMKF
jgi:hypothetical protein